MTVRVLLVNTAKAAAIPPLVTNPDISLSVLTEPRYASLYPPNIDLHLVPNVSDVDAAWKATITIATRHDIACVIAPSERGVPVAGYLRSKLGLTGPSFDVANAMSNKLAMKIRLHQGGVPITRFQALYGLDDLVKVADTIGWPVVVKATESSGSAYCVPLASRREFDEFTRTDTCRRLIDQGPQYIVEEQVDVHAEYHCDAIVHDGVTRFMSVSQYFKPVLAGIKGVFGSYTMSSRDPLWAEITRLHDDAVRAVGFRAGVTHLEILATPDALLVGEIAARPGGGGIPDLLLEKYDLDIWTELMNVSLDRSPEARRSEESDTIAQIMLPASSGQIIRISSSDDFRHLPHVVKAHMFYQAGDVIDNDPLQTELAGLVLARAADPERILPAFHAVDAAYSIEIKHTGR